MQFWKHKAGVMELTGKWLLAIIGVIVLVTVLPVALVLLNSSLTDIVATGLPGSQLFNASIVILVVLAVSAVAVYRSFIGKK